jgi:hypothetical protein
MSAIRVVAALGVLLVFGAGPGIARSAEDEPVQAEEKAKALPDTWFATAVTTVGSRVQFTNYWSSGSRFRAESVLRGHRVVSIVNDDTYYSIDAVLAAGVSIARDPQAIAVDAKRGRPFADEWKQLLRAGGESVGREELLGRKCEVFRLTNSTGRRTVWVSLEEPRVPIRIMTFDRQSGQEETVDYINWLRGLLISSAFFEPGSQVRLLEFDYPEYSRVSRQAPVGPVPVLYRGFLEAEWQD